MKITNKKILLISAAVVSIGFASKLFFTDHSKVSANGSAQFVHSEKVTNFDEGLKNVRSTLPINFKNKVKMPNSFPFKLKKIAASTLPIPNKNAYEERYIGTDGEILTLGVQEGPVEIDYTNNFGEKPVNLNLKDGNLATFFKNHGSVSLNWFDKNSNLTYMMTLYRTKHTTDDELKNEVNSYHIEKLKAVQESLTKIN